MATLRILLKLTIMERGGERVTAASGKCLQESLTAKNGTENDGAKVRVFNVYSE